MRRGLKVSCIYIVGLDVSLFYPEILLTYLLLSELFVLRIRSEIKLFIEFKTRSRSFEKGAEIFMYKHRTTGCTIALA